MKKALSMLISLLMIASLFGCSSPEPEAPKDQLARIKEKGSITIATEGDWAPWTYHDSATGELIGFDVEIGKLIAAELGVQAEFVETVWDSILSGVDSGRFDIACNGVGYSSDRAQNYSFSQPYVYTKKVLIVHADNDTIHSFIDLKDKTTANSISSTYASIAQQFGATVIPVDSLDGTMEMLLKKEVDATINSQDTFNTYIQKNPDAAIKIAAFSDGEKVVIPMRKDADSETLVEAINKAIDDLRTSGKLEELSIKYFGTDNTMPTN